jgi:hypothetical protein
MFNEEFTSFPGRGEMVELIQQRENQGAPLDRRETEAGIWPICVFQTGEES